ncbi:MAG: alanine racemase, partial [Bryobacteraceae bacterium]|nr:alanine racemase [Bryobacteraceae bacterium]
VKVLDLTRVIAGPVATRTLALLGADVLRIDPPSIPEIVVQHLDTGQGKRTALLDVRSADGRLVWGSLLAEADVGLGRVGVAPDEDLVELARHLQRLPGLVFEGVAFYPGHIKRLDEDGRRAWARLRETLAGMLASLRRAGISPRIVSGGSTPTLFESHTLAGLNEIRPGTYIFNDRNTVLSGACSWEDCAATVLTTVVSTARPGQIIIDGGSKTFSSDRVVHAGEDGFGRILEAPEAVFWNMNEEHGYINATGCRQDFRVGDRLRVIPNHVCVAVNLHERVYGVRGDLVEEIWTVEGRGKLQ